MTDVFLSVFCCLITWHLDDAIADSEPYMLKLISVTVLLTGYTTCDLSNTIEITNVYD